MNDFDTTRAAGLLCPLIALLSVLALSGRATAAPTSQGNWVLNGATIDYDAGTGDWLRVGNGTAVINGPNTQFVGATVQVPSGGAPVLVNPITSNGITLAVNGTGCPSSSTLSQNTAYYVYYESNLVPLPDGGVGLSSVPNGLIMTTVPPTETGYANPASGHIAWAESTSFCNDGTSPLNVVFLGSFLTDGEATAHVIPFFRNGENVLFTNPLTTPDRCQVSAALTSTGTIATITLPICSMIPTSASELLLDVTVSNSDTDAHSVIIVDSNQGTFANCAPAGPQNIIGTFFSPASSATGMFQLDYEAQIAAAPSLLLGVCDAAWGTGTVTALITQRGYVEPVHHLNQPR